MAARTTIQTTRSPFRYSDFDNNLSVHPFKQDIDLLTDTDAIKNSIKNIVLTDPQERMFNPFFGAGVNAMLFENITEETAHTLQIQIVGAIENFEPRAKLHGVYVTPNSDENQLDVKIVFSTINNPTPTTLDLILTRIR
jgi:phage baseplate assembly protein W